MSLEREEFLANFRRLTLGSWVRLLLGTFVVPPVIVLVLAQVLPVGIPAMAGLYLIAVAPGAPLMTRNVAKRGFDRHVAAGYQVWGALVAPVMMPPLVAGAAWLYGRDLWISPLEVLGVIAQKQFLPLLLGMALVYFLPAFSARVRRPLNIAGNGVLTVALLLVLWMLVPTVGAASLWVLAAALALAVCCLVTGMLLFTGMAGSGETLALSNVNRHVGLALLLAGAHLENSHRVLPAVAAYALAAPLVMVLGARWMRRGRGVA